MPIRLYWYGGKNGQINFGDSLSPIIVSELSGKDVVFRSILSCDLVGMGSILDKVVRNRWKRGFLLRTDRIKVWGSGSLRPRQGRCRGLDFFAVRGPLTRDAMELDASLPLGDPGLLVNRLVPRTQKRFRWGIIPHIVDRKESIVAHMRNDTPNAVVIDLEDPDLFNTIRLIMSCEFVISSSLHGIIASDALDVPNMWTAITGNG